VEQKNNLNGEGFGSRRARKETQGETARWVEGGGGDTHKQTKYGGSRGQEKAGRHWGGKKRTHESFGGVGTRGYTGSKNHLRTSVIKKKNRKTRKKSRRQRSGRETKGNTFFGGGKFVGKISSKKYAPTGGLPVKETVTDRETKVDEKHGAGMVRQVRLILKWRTVLQRVKFELYNTHRAGMFGWGDQKNRGGGGEWGVDAEGAGRGGSGGGVGGVGWGVVAKLQKKRRWKSPLKKQLYGFLN